MPLKKSFNAKKVLAKAKRKVLDFTGRQAIPGIKMAKRLSAKTADQAIKEGAHKGIHNTLNGFVKTKRRKTITGGKKKVTKLWRHNRRRESREVEIHSRFKGKKLSEKEMVEAISSALTGRDYKGLVYDKRTGTFFRKTIEPLMIYVMGSERKGERIVRETWNIKGEKTFSDKSVFIEEGKEKRLFEKRKMKQYKTS
ncbi:hypothetical protein KKG83_08090 [Candidatus Micrarchaeota archaeon]|nr:hypothetical protein [Candidatus Micrarchaeota archaeon]